MVHFNLKPKKYLINALHLYNNVKDLIAILIDDKYKVLIRLLSSTFSCRW